MRFRPIRNYFTSFAASDHVPKWSLGQQEPVLTATTFCFPPPVVPVFMPLNCWCLGKARTPREGCGHTCNMSWQLLPCKSHPHLCTFEAGVQGWEITSPSCRVRESRGDAHVSGRCCNLPASAHFTASLHRFLLLKFVTRGNLQVLCTCRLHPTESWWGEGCGDITVLPAEYKGTDFPGPHASVLSQPDLLQKNQGELKSWHWRMPQVPWEFLLAADSSQLAFWLTNHVLPHSPLVPTQLHLAKLYYKWYY